MEVDDEDSGVDGRLVGVLGEEDDDEEEVSTTRASISSFSRSGAEARTCRMRSTASGAKRIG